VYYGAVGDSIKAFAISNARLGSNPLSQTGNQFSYPGATPSISANGINNAILWAAENTDPAVLHAYDATNLANELYNSNQTSGGCDQFGTGNKFITPTVSNGKVYVGTTTGVGVFWYLALGPGQAPNPHRLLKLHYAGSPAERTQGGQTKQNSRGTGVSFRRCPHRLVARMAL
jgi:hypothetical protein